MKPLHVNLFSLQEVVYGPFYTERDSRTTFGINAKLLGRKGSSSFAALCFVLSGTSSGRQEVYYDGSLKSQHLMTTSVADTTHSSDNNAT